MRIQLHELLKEDQEPFHLQNYITEHHQRLHSRRQKPSSNFTTKLCKKACFFSSTNSPDVNQSLINAKPHKNVIFLHVPARTAEMLLEASARIRKPKKLDVNRLGSFLKRLKQGSGSETVKQKKNKNNKKKKSGDEEVGVALKDLLSIGRSVTLRQNPTFSPEIKDFNNDQTLDYETEFCSSPFQFVLQNDPYNHQTSSSSPSSAVTEICEKCEGKDLVKQCENEVEEEYCSPVSVLDPDPHADEHEDDIEEDDNSSSFDMDQSYANVQRAQERLLEKLSRFERLAELDPLELKIRFQEEDFSDGIYFSEDEGNCQEMKSSSNKRAIDYTDQLVKEVLNRPEFKKLKRISEELKKVAKVILTEELKIIAFDDKSVLLDRVVRRMASWKEVAGDIMTTMVGHCITQDIGGWARKQEQVKEVAIHIEFAIFEALVEELCEELAL